MPNVDLNDPVRLRAASSYRPSAEPGRRMLEFLEIVAATVRATAVGLLLRPSDTWQNLGSYGPTPPIAPADDPGLLWLFDQGEAAAYAPGAAPWQGRSVLTATGPGVGAPVIDDDGNAVALLVAMGIGEPAADLLRRMDVLAGQAMVHLVARRHREEASDLGSDLFASARSLGLVFPPMPARVDRYAEADRRQEVAAKLRLHTYILGTAIHAARFGGWHVDLRTGEVTFSEQVRRILEWPSGEPMPVDLGLERFDPPSVARLRAAYAACVSRGVPYDLELERTHSDGRRHIVRAVGAALADASGMIVAVQGALQDITATREAELAARRASESLSAIVEGMHDALVVLGPDSHVRYVNRRAIELLGPSDGEVVGRGLYDAFPAIEASSLDPELRDVVQVRSSRSFRLRHGHGSRWLDARAVPTAGDAIALFFEDVSSRVESERERASQQERLRVLADLAHDAVLDWEVDEDRAWWSAGLGALLGVVAPAGEGMRFWISRLHDDERGAHVADLWRAIRGDEHTWISTCRMLTARGEYIRVAHRFRILRDHDGRAIRVIGGLRDRTSEEGQRQLVEEQAALLDELPAAVFTTAPDGEIRWWSRGAERLYGRPATGVVGRPLHDALGVPASDGEALRAAALGSMGAPREHTFRDASGAERAVEARWRPLGPSGALLAVHVDIADRKRADEARQRAQRLESVGALAAGIAHDLNNVLTPIVLACELLDRASADPDPELVARMAASARRGAQLVSMVQAFAGGSEGRRSSVSVALIVREALAAVRADLPAGVRLRDVAPEREIQVSADPAQLLQVLVNLLANARDAMADGGEVRVLWGAVGVSESDGAGLPAGRYAVIDVEDDGPGVPAELRDRIFDPFFTTRAPGNGAGLGLATAATLVVAAGGAMQLLPPGEGGARFRVFLPLAGPPAAEPPTDAPADGPTSDARGALVLVVDDEPLVREVMARTLEAYGFSTLAACDGAEALALYARDPDAVAVVLTDMTMPGMDGAALIHALRQLDPTLPIVAASGIAANGLRARAAGLGVQGFLPKPFGSEELVAAIRRALAAREA